MDGAVDLHSEPVEVRIEVAAATVRRTANRLSTRQRQAGATAQPVEVDLSEGMRPAFDIQQYSPQHAPMTHLSADVELPPQLRCRDQPLLHTGGLQPAGVVRPRQPRRAVDEGTGQPGLRREPNRVDVTVQEAPRHVQ